MEQFKKWFKKNKPYEVYSCMDMAEKAWRAALEWALTQQGKIDWRFFSVILPKDIKKELGDT